MKTLVASKTRFWNNFHEIQLERKIMLKSSRSRKSKGLRRTTKIGQEVLPVLNRLQTCFKYPSDLNIIVLSAYQWVRIVPLF